MRLRPIVTWSALLGLGLGLTLGSGAAYLATPTAALSNEAVRARARDLGMYPLTELPGAEVTLAVGPGSTPEQVAQALVQVGLVTNQTDLLAQVSGKVPKEGVYRLRTNETIESLVGQLFR